MPAGQVLARAGRQMTQAPTTGKGAGDCSTTLPPDRLVHAPAR